MADIKSLLNPVDESKASSTTMSKTRYSTEPPGYSIPGSKLASAESSPQLPSPSLSVFSHKFVPISRSVKKQKLSKDAAIFTRGTIRGELRYPPDNFRDDILESYHQHHEIFPLEDISDYPRHIPYNSEKKTYLDKTGRECFEVLHYNFKVPGEDKVHCMMWDYNIGLVRITPLFKCTGYSKTTPAKMLNRNVGLREICHSITGGALVAQGYWMPYEAAKAIAATFCWNIRFALTPIFGRDFPSICNPPGSDRYGDMIIDAAITLRCAEKAEEYRALENHPLSRSVSIVSSPATPCMPSYPRHSKQIRPKTSKFGAVSSGYSTDVSSMDSYELSSRTPDIIYRNVWTPANPPRSTVNFDLCLPSPREILAGLSIPSNSRTKTTSPTSSNSSSPAQSPKSTRARCSDAEDHYDGGSSGESSTDATKKTQKNACTTKGLQSDVKAAYALMSLGWENTDLGQEKARPGQEGLKIGTFITQDLRGQKRRASAPMENLLGAW